MTIDWDHDSVAPSPDDDHPQQTSEKNAFPIHPLASHLDQRRPPPLPLPSVVIYDDDDDEDDDDDDQSDSDHDHSSFPSSPVKQSMTRKKSMDFLSKIGLRRSTVHESDPYSSSDEADEVSASHLHHHRHSIESTRSFSSPLPPHGERYLKIKTKSKTQNKALSKLVLAQQLTGTPSSPLSSSPTEEEPQHPPHRPHQAIWAMKISKDGKYLAAGGQNCVLRVWETLTEGVPDKQDSIKVFNDKPLRDYKGHHADILDISWSKNNFLLSSSMDKTVRLWHVSNSECLCVFVHLDFVTGIKFHPKDDRFFLSGSLDSKLRLWSIPDKKVAFWNEVPNENLITAVGFTLDGRTACAGSYTGQVYFYETQGLKYNTQISVKKRGAKKGKKITGLEAMPNMPPGEEKLLITSNDSRIRMINMKDKSLIYKYKGLDNATMQIRATFSDDGRFILCGSEDCSVYLWPTGQTSFITHRLDRDSSMAAAVAANRRSAGEGAMTSSTSVTTSNTTATATAAAHSNGHDQQGLAAWLKRGEQRLKDKLHHHHEFFEGHKSIVTNAIFAPHRTRQLLASTGTDIIFNHTPIPTPSPMEDDTMRSSSLSFTNQIKSYLDSHHHHHHKEEDDDNDTRQRRPSSISSNNTSNYRTREKYDYPDSQILVTSDIHGCIQVWRIDSGVYHHHHRHHHHHHHHQHEQQEQSPPPPSPNKRHSMDASSVTSIAPTAMIAETASLSGKSAHQKRGFSLFSSRSSHHK